MYLQLTSLVATMKVNRPHCQSKEQSKDGPSEVLCTPNDLYQSFSQSFYVRLVLGLSNLVSHPTFAVGTSRPMESSPLETPEIWSHILGYLSVLDLRCAASTCRSWRERLDRNYPDRRMLLVTAGGTNEIALVSTDGHIIQRFPVSPTQRTTRKRKRGLAASRRPGRERAYCWPTCMALTPAGNLLVSQYKVEGVLEFARSREGFAYRRILASHSSLTFPEGLVVAHNSVYVASVDSAIVTRLTLAGGQIIEQVGSHQDDDDMMTLWGMCISPDDRSLFIAAHVSDETDYQQPTSVNTGVILRLDLERDGSFQKDGDGYPIGYSKEVFQVTRFTDDGILGMDPTTNLNRPSNPAFCRHGILHVSSFVSAAEGERRRIRRFACLGFPWTGTECRTNDRPWSGNVDLGCLEENEPTRAGVNRVNPWGVACSQASDEVFVTCSDTTTGSSSPCLAKFASCGCKSKLEEAPRRNGQRPTSRGVLPFHRSTLGAQEEDPGPISSDKCTCVVESATFSRLNAVCVID